MAEGFWSWGVKYDEELVKEMQQLFINKIVPDNFILVVHKYNRNVLTLVDIEHLQKSSLSKATKEVNYELLLKMKNYEGWFEVILQVCKDPDVKQDYLAEAFEKIKRNLDAKWTKDQTEKKEINTGLANITLRSESNQGTVAMGRQLSTNGVWETDSACMSSESIQWNDKNTKELSTEDKSRPTQQSSWEGLKLKNGKLYCDICLTSLTSQKAADDHCKGKQHQKKLKEAFAAGQEWSKTDITMAAISQTPNDAKVKPPNFEPNPASNEAAVSSVPLSDYNVTSASLKPVSCIDEGNTKKPLNRSESRRSQCRS